MQSFVSLIMVAFFSSFGTMEMEGHGKWIALIFYKSWNYQNR